MKNAPYVECMWDGTGDDLTYYFLSKLVVLLLNHSLANKHSCLTPAENEGIDSDNSGSIAWGMINQ